MAGSLDCLLPLLLLATLLLQVATQDVGATTPAPPCTNNESLGKGTKMYSTSVECSEPRSNYNRYVLTGRQDGVGLDGLNNNDAFHFWSLGNITHLQFPNLRKIERLFFSFNFNLESIDLPVLESLDVLYIYGNPALKKINVNAAAKGGQFVLLGNRQLEKASFDAWNKLEGNHDITQELGACHGYILYSTSELSNCTSIDSSLLKTADMLETRTIGGGMPDGVEEEGIEVSAVRLHNTNIETLAFLKIGGNYSDNHNELHSNPSLCDEGLFEKFNVTLRSSGSQHTIHSNCDAICDPHELTNPADAEQLTKCTTFRDNKNLIGEGQLTKSMPKVTAIQGKVVLKGTKLKDLSLLKNIQSIESQHDVALEIVDNKELNQIELSVLQTLKSKGEVKLRIRGNKKKLTEEEYEKLKGQLKLKEKEMDIECFEPTTTTTTTPPVTTRTATTPSAPAVNVPTPSYTSTEVSATTEESSGDEDSGSAEEPSSLALTSGSTSGDGNGSSTGKKVGIAIGIIIALLVLLAIAGFLVYWFVIRKKLQEKRTDEEEKKLPELIPKLQTEQTSKSGLVRGEEMNTAKKNAEQAGNHTTQ